MQFPLKFDLPGGQHGLVDQLMNGEYSEFNIQAEDSKNNCFIYHYQLKKTNQVMKVIDVAKERIFNE